MHPRLLITQSIHCSKWSLPRGLVVAVDSNKGTRTVLGERVFANILASRNTAIRVDGHGSMNAAVEKYHKKTSAGYKRLQVAAAARGSSLCYEGTELLLYVHELQSLATVLMSNKRDKQTWASYLRTNVPFGAVKPDSSTVLLQTVLAGSTIAFNWHSFDILHAGGLNWKYNSQFPKEIKAFATGEDDTQLSEAVVAAQQVLKGLPASKRKSLLDILTSSAELAEFAG